ncbi:hypothetical protein [Planctomicrobium sp. SH664]|uniref:hypothetical protein n=1 Tax=Planctomicrobium sp. SH664 TaxID=3448125 RepID=UPI003F5B4506
MRNFGLPFIAELRRVLPLDFPSTLPVYVVSDVDCRHRMGMTFQPGLWGWTGPDQDLGLKSLLQADGDWRGRGFGTVIVESAFLEYGSAHRYYALLNLTFHEAGHFITYPAQRTETHDLDPTETPSVIAAVENPLISSLTAEQRAMIWSAVEAAQRAADPEFSSKQRGHGPTFLRVMAHVSHRMTAAGLPAMDSLLTRSSEPWTCFQTYWSALGDEPVRLVDLSIREILTLGPPTAFSELAAADEERLSRSEAMA